MGDFTDLTWYRELGERVLRNEIQALIPLLAVLSATHSGFDLVGLGLSVLYVAVWTTVKAVAFSTFNLHPTGWRETLWRIASAVASSLVANVPEKFWGYDHWDRVGYAAAGAVLTCLLMLYGTPPTQGANSESSVVLGKQGDTPGV